MNDETVDKKRLQYNLFHQQLPNLISCPRCSQSGTPPLPSGNADYLKVCRSPPPCQAGQVMYKDFVQGELQSACGAHFVYLTIASSLISRELVSYHHASRARRGVLTSLSRVVVQICMFVLFMLVLSLAWLSCRVMKQHGSIKCCGELPPQYAKKRRGMIKVAR
jgi:hypothetical protein